MLQNSDKLIFLGTFSHRLQGAAEMRWKDTGSVIRIQN